MEMKSQMLDALVERVKDIVENNATDYPGRKIDQIKELRAATNFGLKHSKDIVENWLTIGKANASLYENLIKDAINERHIFLDYGEKVVKESDVSTLKGDEYMVVWTSDKGKAHYVAPTVDEAIRFKDFILSDDRYWNVKIASINWQ